MILDNLNKEGKLYVITDRPLCIYSKDSVSHSTCWDNYYNCELDINKIDDSYGLIITEYGDRINISIPKNARCILKKSSPQVDCTIIYKNIECDLTFEDEPIDDYFILE